MIIGARYKWIDIQSLKSPAFYPMLDFRVYTQDLGYTTETNPRNCMKIVETYLKKIEI